MTQDWVCEKVQNEQKRLGTESVKVLPCDDTCMYICINVALFVLWFIGLLTRMWVPTQAPVA